MASEGMHIVAGLSIKNLRPRIWDPSSPHYLPDLRAIMVSYAEFHQWRRRRHLAMEQSLRAYLGIPAEIKIYLDNGAFYFLARPRESVHHEYREFIERAQPDWYPIPQDDIPSPSMSIDQQRGCLRRTMAVNLAHQHNGYVPVIHISQVIDEYIAAVRAQPHLAAKPAIALGGIVPNLLRMPKARPYREILDSVERARHAFADKDLHLFGVGGTATLHLAALLGMDSVDSSGWRNRAARGIVQLPGSGDRLVADLGNWRGRVPNDAEWKRLGSCSCPACQRWGVDGLRARVVEGFSNRATHNLWVLLWEAAEIRIRLANGTYDDWYEDHLDNSIYRPLVRVALTMRSSSLAARRRDPGP